MSEMTLREICNLTGVTRRAIQGYENTGLVSAIRKNDRGYLLYDESALETIKRMKLFQEMGFSIKEIKELERASNDIIKKSLNKRINELKKEYQHMDHMIEIAVEMMKQL